MKLLKSTTLFSVVIFSFLIMGFSQRSSAQTTIGPVNMGHLTDYLFVFTDGNVDANWQSASKGFSGNVAINGLVADERTSGTFPYGGRIFTNDATLDAWQNIVDQNAGQAFASYNEGPRLTALETDLENAFDQINALAVTPGYAAMNASDLDGLNTQNGIAQVLVINVTSGFSISAKINITGDATDIFILRWDTDAIFANGYNGKVKFQSGGGIVPLGGLNPANFIHVAGDITSSGGGTTPAAPYPQGPRTNNGTGPLVAGGTDFAGGGFFTGYWLTTGSPTTTLGLEQPFGYISGLSNAIFVGGWYTKTSKFSMTSGTSGVYVSPPVEDPGPEKRGVNNNDITPNNTFKTSLLKSYPNPFTQSTTIQYTLGSNENVVINIYNMAGKQIATLVNEEQLAGEHLAQWNAGANPNGIYLVELKAGTYSGIKKLMIAK